MKFSFKTFVSLKLTVANTYFKANIFFSFPISKINVLIDQLYVKLGVDFISLVSLALTFAESSVNAKVSRDLFTLGGSKKDHEWKV